MANATAAKKKLDEKHLKILKDLVAHDTNKHCFDCRQRGPTYVNVTIGSFVCTNCGGALRKYNHRVKSMVMSNFTTQEMEFLMKRGNEACRKIFFGQNDGKFPTEVDISDDRHLDDHLRQKYERKKWYVEPTQSIEDAAVALNQGIYEKAEKGGSKSSSSQQNQFARMPNASAGLIMPAPSRPLPKPGVNSSVTSTGSITISRPSPTLLASANISLTTTTTTTATSTPLNSQPINGTSSSFTSMNTTSGLLMDPFPMAPPAMSTSKVDDLFGPPLSPFLSQPVQSAPFQASFGASSQFMTSSTTSSAAVAGPKANNTSTLAADKYAALKELDGLFGSISTPTVPPSTTANISTTSFYSSTTSTAPFWAQPGPAVTQPASNTNLWSTASPFQSTQPSSTFASIPTNSDPFHTANLGAPSANPFFSMSTASWSSNAVNSSVPTQPFATSSSVFSQPSVGGLPSNPINPFNPFMRDNPLPPPASGNSASAPFGNVPPAACTNPFL